MIWRPDRTEKRETPSRGSIYLAGPFRASRCGALKWQQFQQLAAAVLFEVAKVALQRQARQLCIRIPLPGYLEDWRQVGVPLGRIHAREGRAHRSHVRRRPRNDRFDCRGAGMISGIFHDSHHCAAHRMPSRLGVAALANASPARGVIIDSETTAHAVRMLAGPITAVKW